MLTLRLPQQRPRIAERVRLDVEAMHSEVELGVGDRRSLARANEDKTWEVLPLASVVVPEQYAGVRTSATDEGTRQHLKESLALLGQLVPVVVDEENVVLDGVQRVGLLRELGVDQVLAVRVSGTLASFRAVVRIHANVARRQMGADEAAALLEEVSADAVAAVPLEASTRQEWLVDRVVTLMEALVETTKELSPATIAADLERAGRLVEVWPLAHHLQRWIGAGLARPE